MDGKVGGLAVLVGARIASMARAGDDLRCSPRSDLKDRTARTGVVFVDRGTEYGLTASPTFGISTGSADPLHNTSRNKSVSRQGRLNALL